MNDARTRLADWIERTKVSQRHAAKLLGMHFTFLNNVLTGRRVPGLTNAVKIERVTGIPAVSWVPSLDGDLVGVSISKARKRSIGKA